LADLSHDQAISFLLDYENIPDPTINPDWAHPNPDEVKQLREAVKAAATPEEKRQIQQDARRVEQTRLQELRGWWLQRMARGPRPLQEKLVLFWHGHFATSGKTSCSAGWQPATGNSCSMRPARIPRCWSGWIRRKAKRNIRMKILPER
jgi:hypothetical protein